VANGLAGGGYPAAAGQSPLPLRFAPAGASAPFDASFSFPFIDRLYSFDGVRLAASEHSPGASFSRWWSARLGEILAPDLAKAALWCSGGGPALSNLGFSPEGWTAAACLEGALLAFARVYEPEKGFAYRLYPSVERLDHYFEGHLGLFVSDIAYYQGRFIAAGSTLQGDAFQLWSMDAATGRARLIASMERSAGFLRVLPGAELYCYVSSPSKEGPGDASLYAARDGSFAALSSRNSPLTLFYGSGFALEGGNLLLPGIGPDGSALLAEALVAGGVVDYGAAHRLPAPSYQALGMFEGSAILICYDHFSAPGDFVLARIRLE
jgi:hypothetical protein